MTLTFSSPMPDAAAAFAAIERIRAMHTEDAAGFCLGCDYGWPCDTIKALEPAVGAQPNHSDTQQHRPPPADNVVTDAADDKSVKAT